MKAMGRRAADFVTFARNFVRHPKSTGAVAPSSGALAHGMLRDAPLAPDSTVVEFGPGTGSFTRRILEILGPDGRLLALDRNAEFVDLLSIRYPRGDFIRGNAAQVLEIAASRGIEAVDAVISGLPFANFEPSVQREIVRAAWSVIRPGGYFATFQYHHSWLMPRARRFRQIVREYFPAYGVEAVLWNLPPALVIKGTKARETSPLPA